MEMTINQRIERFIEKYPEPKQYKFHLKVTGERWNWARNNGYDFAHSPSSVGYYIASYRYDEETDLFETATIWIDCHRRNYNRKWKYHHRYFVTRENREIYDCNGNIPSMFVCADSTGDLYRYDKRHYIMSLTNLGQAPDFYSEFEKFAKGDYNCAGRSYDDRSPYFLRNWIMYKGKRRKENVSDIQKCMSIELNTFDASTLLYGCDVYYIYDSKKAIVETHDGVIVFRQFVMQRDEQVKEINRVYFFSPKKIFYLKHNKDGSWSKNGSFTRSDWNGVIINPNVFDGKYDFVNKIITNKKTIYHYVVCMREPIFEQMFKMGIEDLIIRAFQSWKSPLSFLDSHFLVSDDKKKDKSYKRYEFTAKQLKIICEYLTKKDSYGYCHYFNSRELQKFKMSYDISHMDINKFELLIPYINEISKIMNCTFYEIQTPGTEQEKIVFERMCRIANREKNNNIFTLYRDTKRFYDVGYLNINPMEVKKVHELQRLHDAGLEVSLLEQRKWEAKQNAEMEEQRKKTDKKRKGWNYEDEDTYIIRLPNEISEIATEGQKLHHCVGGYTRRHAMGDTTILFLREKANPENPFYTIEVDKNNVVVQIHGFGNKWLGNDPDAIPTVMRWLRKNEISCSDHILTCTATGYGSTSNHVNLPVI